MRSAYNQAITRNEMGAWQSGTIPPPAPTPPTPTPPTTALLGDWVQCSSNSQCRNGCCSGQYSGGMLKCTPLVAASTPPFARQEPAHLLHPPLLHPPLLQLDHLETEHNAPETPSAGMDAAVACIPAVCSNAPHSVAV